jgi:hypothetical protein
MRKLLFAALIICNTSTAFAQFRCVENGKTLYTDKPCPEQSLGMPATGSKSKVIGDTGNSAYSTPYGEWRGQIQYQTTYQGKPVAEAHAVVQTTISIDLQGKVRGASPDNGCKMKGIASPGISRALLNLDHALWLPLRQA